MSGLQRVITAAKTYETLLVERLAATGKGLNEKTDSVQNRLPVSRNRAWQCRLAEFCELDQELPWIKRNLLSVYLGSSESPGASPTDGDALLMEHTHLSQRSSTSSPNTAPARHASPDACRLASAPWHGAHAKFSGDVHP